MGLSARGWLIVRSEKKRRLSTTRVVGYRFGGDIGVVRAMDLLDKARAQGVVMQFNGTKSMERDLDVVWFNGPPGRAMRDLRARIAARVI